METRGRYLRLPPASADLVRVGPVHLFLELREERGLEVPDLAARVEETFWRYTEIYRMYETLFDTTRA